MHIKPVRAIGYMIMEVPTNATGCEYRGYDKFNARLKNEIIKKIRSLRLNEEDAKALTFGDALQKIQIPTSDTNRIDPLFQPAYFGFYYLYDRSAEEEMRGLMHSWMRSVFPSSQKRAVFAKVLV